MSHLSRATRTLLAMLVSLLLVALGLPTTAQAGTSDGEITVSSYVTGHEGEIATISAGDAFSITVNMQCSSPDTGWCTNTEVELDLPQPMVFASDPLTVSPAVATGVVSGQKLFVTFNGQGLEAGQLVVLTVKATVPAHASGNLDGDTVSATVAVTADNADPVNDSVAIKLSIPPVLQATTTKQVSPTGTQPALPGRTVTYTLTGANDSNVSVESVRIAEPTNPTAASPFTYLAVTGISTLTPPEGADRVEFDWFDGSDWQTSGAVAIPSDPNTLLPADPSLIQGMRFTFTKDGGFVPVGDAAKIVITTATRTDAFSDLNSGDTRTVANQASAIVSYLGKSADDQATASLTFKMTPVEVTTSKSITGDSLVAGASTVVTIDATNGIMPVSTMQIDEPQSGQPNLADQGLVFGGFINTGETDQRVEWPHNANSAEVTYYYSDSTSEVLTTTTTDTLPAADGGKQVTSFSVKFTGANDAIISGASAKLAFQVTAAPVLAEAGHSATNTVKTTVTDSSGTAGVSTAEDSVTLLPRRVRAGATKTLSRESLWAAAGSTMTVSLTGSVSQESTIGSDYLTLTDSSYSFWDSFNLRRIIATDIPADAVLTVEYYDGAAWQTLTTQAGPSQDWTFTPSNPDQIAGIRFRFTPQTAGDVLPIGFNVAPRFEVGLRQYLRSDALIPTSSTAPTTLVNEVTTEVGNPVAIQQTATKTASDSVDLKATGGGGGGAPDLVAKNWVTSNGLANEYQIYALSADTRTARIDWDTDGLSMSQFQVIDDPRGATGNVATSVYDAFDLVSIAPITTAIDPLIGNDKVSAVELYTGAGWSDITSQACPSASSCDGKFPGYTLTDAQRADTQAVRITFAPGGSNSAIAISASSSPSRGILLTMKLRNTLRSSPAAYVLGTSHDYTYNTGTKGVTDNRADATGTLTTPTESGTTAFADTASASMVIYDRPLNVSVTKSFDQDRLGLPQAATTSQSDYPLITSTLTAHNNTATFVPEIKISDPSTEVSGLGAYEYLNLHQIEVPDLPDDLSSSDVVVDLVHWDGVAAPTTSSVSLADALSSTSTQLADVIGVTVHFGSVANLGDSTKPLIAAGSLARVQLTYQLRATLRSSGTQTVPVEQITNSALATIVSPGGMGCVGGESCDTPTAADSDSFGIVQPTYEVAAGKAISPSSRYEDQTTNYTVTLTGQPSGTARTKLLTLTDDSATFWNAFDLTSIPTVTVPAPINQLKLAVLTGVGYADDGTTLSYTCNNSPVLDACWHEGTWTDAVNGQVGLSLPAGITADQVRGVRVDARSVVGGTAVQWERPSSPTLNIGLALNRRSLLAYGPGGSTTTPVPSTRPGMTMAPGEPVQGTITNTTSVQGTAGWLNNQAPYTATQSATATTVLNHRINQIKVEKTPGKTSSTADTPRFDLNETIPFQLKITNTGAWNITGLALTDQVGTIDTGTGPSAGLVPADVTSVFTFKVNGATATGFAAALDTATGALSITVPSGFVLTAGSVLQVTANLRFRDHLEAGTTVSNYVSVTSDRTFERCDFSYDALAETPTTTVDSCSSTTHVAAAASTPISVNKSVKGVAAGDPDASPGDTNYNDLGVISVGNADASLCATPGTDGYYAPPCTPITRPGGTERWRLTLTNGGNVSANTVSTIDVLPAVGDTGVTIGTARKSRFTPVFAGNVKVTLPDGAATNAVHTYFTTSTATPACNKSDILNDTTPGGTSNCSLAWVEFTDATSAATLATAKAIKVVVSFADSSKGIVPGGQFQMTFDTTTPAQSEVADPTTVEPVAWNSAAIGSRTAYVAQTETTPEFPARASLITEPRKAGVALASGRINLAKTVAVPEGALWTAALPTSYTGDLSCNSLGKSVALNGTTTSITTSGVTLTGTQGSGTGTVVNYNADGSSTLPLFAECSFTEDAAQGATATTSPTTVTAHNSYASVANVAHGWAGSATNQLTLTNTYADAGFTVTKHVTGPVAKDASNTAVAFKDFTYSASCLLNGTEVVPVGDRTFSLRDTQSHAITNLPAGATCTVKETYAASAAETTVSANQGSTTLIDGVTGDTAAFTLVAGGATASEVSFTNRFTVGATEITKAIVDPTGLWGDENFEAHLVCTHPDTINETVYDATVALSKAAPVQTIGSLPTGASCTVTETKTGGANSTAISGATFTVGNNPSDPSKVTITNTFTTGSVTVSKLVQANGADTTASPWGDGNFPVTLACTRVVDGVTTTLTVPNADQTLKKGAWSHTWTGLPTGATCSATEDTAGITGIGAAQPLAATTITAPVDVVASSTKTITVTNNYTAGKLVINKALTGAGTSFFTSATFSVDCTLGGSSVFSQSGITVTTPSLKSAEIGPIPFGAVCTATETATGGADATPTAAPVTIVENGATNNVTDVTFTNAFSAGKVTISKLLSGAAAGEPWATSPTFTLAVKCGLAAAGPYSYNGNVSLKGGQSAVLQKSGSDQLFPVGTHCWATETGTANATSTALPASTFATGVVVTTQADASVPQALTITATNTYEYASLTVSKSVVTADARDQDNNPLLYNRTYTITAACASFNGVTILTTQTLNFSDQGSGVWGPDVTFNNLPAKASCTVTETTAWGANTTTYKVTQNGTTGSAVAGFTKTLNLTAGANAVAFTNTYMIGSITLTKVLAGTGTAWATYPFTVNLTCTASWFSPSTIYNKNFTFTSAADLGPRTITNLPTGANCTVTEPDHHGADAFAATNVVVNTGVDVRAAKATNTYNTGAVKVTKQLKVNGTLTTTAQPWISGGYPITLSCTKDLDGNGTTDAVNLGANATKTVTGNGSATWTGLPYGAICTATEDNTAITYPPSTPAQPLPTVTVSGTATVPNDSTYVSPAAITVTNDFGYGSVKIVKTLAGPAVDTWATGNFTFHTSCALDGFGTPVFETDTTLSKATTLTASGIGPVPVGAICTVTETNSAWATSVTPSSATVALAAIASGGVGEADFTNTFDYAGFTVQKSVSTNAKDASGAAIKYTGSYPFTASCKIGATEFLTAQQQSFSLTDGQSKTFDQLPAGAVCTVTETDALSAASTSITTDQSGHSQTVESATSKQFALVAGGVSANTLKFTNSYTTGSLQITKLVAGAGADTWGTGTFEVKTECTLTNATDHSGNTLVYSNTHQLTKDNPNNFWEITDLPTDANCTVSETKTTGANSSAIDAPNPVIDTGTQLVNITNTFGTGSVKVTKAITANATSVNTREPWKSGTYPVTLKCTKDFTNDGTAEALDLDSVLGSGYSSKTITGAGTAQWDGLPQGATCTVTEGTSTVADQPQPTASVGSTDVGNATIAPLTLTNEFTAGKLVIHKDITGNATSWGTGPFTFAVSCTQAGVGTVFSTEATLTPTVGQTSLDSAALGPIPFASVCAVTETGAGGATNVTSPSPVTITEDAATSNTHTVTFTNEFAKAGFTVTKAVTSSAKNAAGALITYKAAAFTASCQFKGAEALTNSADRSFTLAAGASKTFSDLPTGAACTVTESNVMGAATTDVRIKTASTDVTNTGTAVANFTLVSGNDATATTATFTNNYTTGSAEITKTTLGTGAGLWGAGPFTVSLNCTLAAASNTTVFSTTHVLNPGETWTVPDLATNASCTVSETKAAAANTVAYSPAATFTVNTATKSVEVRNTYTLGAVKVTKALTLNGSATTATPWTQGTYTVKLACTRNYNGSATAIDIPGDSYTQIEALDGVRTITGNGNAVYDSLPTGATCSATEVASSPAAQATVISPATVSVGSNPLAPQAITVTNDFHTSTMTISKQLAGAGQASFGDGPFTFAVSCTLPGATGTVFADSGISLTRAVATDTVLSSSAIGPIPVGGVCEITETGSGGADFTPDPVTITIGETAATNVAGFTNQFSAGTVNVTKVLDGAAKASAWATGATFTVNVECQADLGAGAVQVFSRDVEVKGGATVNVTDAGGDPSRVPLGSHCWATETDAQGAGATAVDAHDWATAAVVTAGTPSTLQPLTLTATNTYEYTGFTVTKQVDQGGAKTSSGADVDYLGSFGFHADCTFNGASVLSQDFTLARVSTGVWQTKQFDHLPAGAACTVNETSTANAATTSTVLTQNGTAAGLVDGTTASFTLVRGTGLWDKDSPTVTVAAFTNTYATGAATITKAVTGSGADAWGNDTFTVQTTCTLDTDADPGTDPVTVYDASHNLTKADNAWAITKLPTGASCSVQETASGGANTPASDHLFTVNADPAHPTAITMTNEFTTGSVRIDKVITVDGKVSSAAPYDTAEYQVKLACTRVVNGTDVKVDIPGDAVGANDPNDGVRTITGAGSALYDGLPTSASCTATEVGTEYALPGSQVTVDQPAAVGTGTTVAATITNDYHTGKLSITKALTGAGATDWATAETIFTVDCSLTGAKGTPQVFFTDDVTLSRATSLTSKALGPIPVGAECTITETATGGATIAASPTKITIADTADNAVTMTNQFDVGTIVAATELTVDGVTTQAAPYTGSKISLELSCQREVNGHWIDVTIPGGATTVVTGADSHSFTGLPVGARCSLAQTDASLTPQGVTYRSDTGTTGATNSHTETVLGSQPVTVTAIDNFETEPLTVAKVLAGAGANDFAVHPFVFSVRCTLAEKDVSDPHVVYANDALSLSKADGLVSAGLGPIPVGSECTVSETADGGATIASKPQHVTISAGLDNRASLTNTFDAGSVKVTKKILVDGETSAAQPYASGTYTMKLACTQQVDGLTLPVTIPGGDTRTITGAGSAEFSALPLGAACSVSESASSLAVNADQISIDHPTFTVGAEPTEVAVTNAFHTSSLMVKVDFSGVGRDAFAKPISVQVDCTLAGASGSVLHTVVEVAPTPGQPTTSTDPLGPIPVGSVCSITTLSAQGADAVPSVVQVTGEANTTAVATIAATYSAGTITVIKKLTGSGASQHKSTAFQMAITCQQADGAVAVVSGTVTITGAGSATLSDASGQPVLAPAHSHCWASETATGGAKKVTIDHGSFATAVHVNPDLPDTVQPLTITVTNEFSGITDYLAYTGTTLGWGIPALGLLSIGLGVWLSRRSRRRDETS
jgi:large repetitive protein